MSSRDGRFWKTAKRGALGVRTLLPKGAEIPKRGGKGFELWGNPHDPNARNAMNPAPQFNESDIDVCLWRIEVEPPDRAESHRFLNVVIPYGDREGRPAETLSPLPAAFELIEDGDRDGVRLKVEGTVWEVVFDRTGALGGSVTLSRAGDKAVRSALSPEVKDNRVSPGTAVSPKTSR